jgi:hypothetical protein
VVNALSLSSRSSHQHRYQRGSQVVEFCIDSNNLVRDRHMLQDQTNCVKPHISPSTREFQNLKASYTVRHVKHAHHCQGGVRACPRRSVTTAVCFAEQAFIVGASNWGIILHHATKKGAEQSGWLPDTSSTRAVITRCLCYVCGTLALCTRAALCCMSKCTRVAVPA